jgi:hypothetical protein
MSRCEPSLSRSLTIGNKPTNNEVNLLFPISPLTLQQTGFVLIIASSLAANTSDYGNPMAFWHSTVA